MRTLGISVVATVAAILAWQIRLPHRMWPQHPQLADFLLVLIVCFVLQYTWPNATKKSK